MRISPWTNDDVIIGNRPSPDGVNGGLSCRLMKPNNQWGFLFFFVRSVGRLMTAYDLFFLFVPVIKTWRTTKYRKWLRGTSPSQQLNHFYLRISPSGKSREKKNGSCVSVRETCVTHGLPSFPLFVAFAIRNATHYVISTETHMEANIIRPVDP